MQRPASTEAHDPVPRAFVLSPGISLLGNVSVVAIKVRPVEYCHRIMTLRCWVNVKGKHLLSESWMSDGSEFIA